MAVSPSICPAHVSKKKLIVPGSELTLETEECIDLQYMKATANNPVGLYACAGLGNTGAADKGINWPLVNVTA